MFFYTNVTCYMVSKMAAGFKPRSIRPWVFCLNHLTTAPRLDFAFLISEQSTMTREWSLFLSSNFFKGANIVQVHLINCWNSGNIFVSSFPCWFFHNLNRIIVDFYVLIVVFTSFFIVLKSLKTRLTLNHWEIQSHFLVVYKPVKL